MLQELLMGFWNRCLILVGHHLPTQCWGGVEPNQPWERVVAFHIYIYIPFRGSSLLVNPFSGDNWPLFFCAGRGTSALIGSSSFWILITLAGTSFYLSTAALLRPGMTPSKSTWYQRQGIYDFQDCCRFIWFCSRGWQTLSMETLSPPWSSHIPSSFPSSLPQSQPPWHLAEPVLNYFILHLLIEGKATLHVGTAVALEDHPHTWRVFTKGALWTHHLCYW